MSNAYMQYFQKSKIFLYPLLDIRKGKDFVPIETYICWDGLYHTNEYKYICVYDTPRSLKFNNFEKSCLLSHPLIDYQEQNKDKQIYVFDYFKYKHDFDMFLNGQYSKFSIKTKEKILNYFGEIGKISGYIKSYLNPEEYHEIYAEALDVNINIIKQTHELCTPPDLTKETLFKKIPDDIALLKNNCLLLKKIN
jgi:hypothetical protein